LRGRRPYSLALVSVAAQLARSAGVAEHLAGGPGPVSSGRC